MNILDVIALIIGNLEVKKGFLPAQPDNLMALFEYNAAPPEHSFGGMDLAQGVQVRVRNLDAVQAYQTVERIAYKLNRYHADGISVLQSTPILDIGRDEANPPRQEYTVNFTVRRY